MGGSSAGGGGGGTEAPNSLLSLSYLRIQDALCEGPISGFALQSGIYGSDPLCSTFFNDVVCRNLDGSYNINVSGQGFSFSYTLGTPGQVAMSGFEYVFAQVPLPPNTVLSNPPVNAGSPVNVYATFNTTQYPDADSLIVTYRVPQMYATDTNGNTNGFEIDVQGAISLNNGPFVPLDVGDSFVGKNTTPYFRTYQYTLPKTTPASSFYQWTVKFYKTSQDVQSTSVANSIYVDSIEIVSASQYRYPNTAMAGLFIDALQFATVPSRAYLIQGMLISVPSGYTPTTYNPNGTITPAVYPNVWNGTFTTGVWTDNPAWVFYDFVTNPRYGLGQYINTANIDIWTLYQLSQYCDEMVDNGLNNGGLEPQFTCNAFIKEPQDAYGMLLNLASAFRGMLYYANGTIRANPTDNKTPVFNYTNANAIGGVFNYASTARNARHNAVQVKYTDPLNLYRDNYVLLEDNQGIIQYGRNQKDIDAFGCSSVGQATRVGNWILTTERLRTETVNFQAGEDALYVRPGDVFNLYDNFRMNRNQGGRVMGFDPTQQFITLDRTVNLDSGAIYALTCIVPTYNLDATGDITGSNQIPFLRNPQIQSCMVLNADISGLSTLQVSGGFSGLMKNAVWVLSSTGVYTSGYVPTVFEQAPQYECLNITQSSPGIFDVLGLNYNTGINYTVNTGFSVIFNAINSGNNIPPLGVTNLTANLITGALPNGNSFYSYLNLTWSASLSSNVSYYTVSGDPGAPGTYDFLGNTTSTGFRFINGVTGAVDFKVFAAGRGGALSPPAAITYTFSGVPGVDTNQIRFWELPAGFGDLEQVAMFYNRPSPATTSTNVYFATGFNTTFKQVMDSTFYPALGVSASGLSTSGTTIYFNSNSFDAPTINSQSASAQASNTVLFLIDNELMSVGTITGLANDQYAFTASRGVLGTFPTTHSANVSGWLFNNSDLESFTDQSLVNVFNSTRYDTGIATRYFQIENNTATLVGAQVPATPGISYTLPNPLPGVPTNLSGTVGTGKIVRLTWVAPQNDNIIDYNIYRATGPSYTDRTGIGTDVNTHYDDINVVLGTTYEYWVTSVNQEEQESTFSTPVFETPQFLLPSGVTPYPPADPTQMTLNGSGNYFAQDGTLLAYLSFNVPAPTSGTAYQNLVYQRHGISTTLTGAQIGAQVSYTGATTATIYDLSPNVSYDIGSQSISNFGQFSADIVFATSSPITAPYSSVIPNAPGSPPNTPVGLMASGGLGGTANFIALSWVANTEPNLEEYGVYRNIINTIPSTPIANVGSNSFVDGNVTGGFTYYYWLTAVNRNEQGSAATASVNASTENPPSIPTAPTLSSSGGYYASDGTALSYLTFNMGALPAGAVGQYLLYLTTDGPRYIVGNDLNNTNSTTATISDLSPGVPYYVAVQAYSLNGISTQLVTGVGAPYTAPNINTPPSPPTLVTGINLMANGGYTGYGNLVLPIAPQYQTTPALFGSIGEVIPAFMLGWTLSTSTGISFYNILISGFNSNSTGVTLSVPATQNQALIYGYPALHFTPTFYYYVQAVDRFGHGSVVTGDPLQFTNPNYYGSLGVFTNSIYSQGYAGNMGFQSSTGISINYASGDAASINSLTGNNAVANNMLIPSVGGATLTVAGAGVVNSTYGLAIGGSTARPVLVAWPFNGQVMITGSATNLTPMVITIPSSAGFNHAPDTCNVCATNKPSNDILLNYDSTNSANSSTIAYLLARTVDGSNFVPGFNLQISANFIEYT